MTAGLSPVERVVYYDFVVAFTEPDAVSRRLGAIERLKSLDDTYDEIVARAVVLYQAGQRERARDTLRRGVEDGRRDSEIASFLRALE